MTLEHAEHLRLGCRLQLIEAVEAHRDKWAESFRKRKDSLDLLIMKKQIAGGTFTLGNPDQGATP